MDSHTLIRLADTYGHAEGVSHWAVSMRCAGKGDLFARLHAGRDVTMRTGRRITQFFSDNWPEDTPWPPDIPRPAPSPDSPAAKPPEPVADPLAVTLAELELLDQAMLAGDLEAMKRHKRRMWNAALTLRENGRIASVEALCRAVGGVERTTYDDVVRRYADGRSDAGKSPRRPDSPTGQVLGALIAAGDVRFAWSTPCWRTSPTSRGRRHEDARTRLAAAIRDPATGRATAGAHRRRAVRHRIRGGAGRP